MTRRQVLAMVGVFALGLALVALALEHEPATSAEGHEAENDADEPRRGPHGGRLLASDDGFAVEMTIYEPGIPPQSRVYSYEDGRVLYPGSVQLVVELHRFDRVDTVKYTKQGDFLLGDKVVEEPHSFDVKVRAEHTGKTYTWEYPSYEGRVEIPPEAAAASGLVIEQAGPRELALRTPVLGQVGFNQDTVRHLSARYAGVVREVRKQVGDRVRAGEAVAVVEANESLQTFEVRTPASGQVVAKHVTVGEVVELGEALYVVADLATVWIDFTVYREDLPRIRSGQRVLVGMDEGSTPLEGTLAYVAPVSHAESQSATARAVVKNPDAVLRPGLYVKGVIVTGSVQAPVTVKSSALQTFRDWDVVFKQKGTIYEIGIVELGVSDGDWLEVRSGLSPGQAYVADNSFVVKAEIGKSGATHDH